MTFFAAQYLESSYPEASPQTVRTRLRQAFDLLPISTILLGWKLPAALEEAVAVETHQQGVALYRWHPLLASDAGFSLPSEWQSWGPQNNPISGFKGMPEFTFMCPNHPGVQDWLSERLETAIQRGLYQGIFLDRIRWPSPAVNLVENFACFCPYCQRAAADRGLDLERVRLTYHHLLKDTDGVKRLISTFFTPGSSDNILEDFFRFRSECISETVRRVSLQIHNAGLAVGLDCFSPCLTRMVGQDLSLLSQTCDWMKLMIYPHVFGPAGLPYEVLCLANGLNQTYRLPLGESLSLIAQACGLQVPQDVEILKRDGFGVETIQQEISRIKKNREVPIYAGVALVQMENIHSVDDNQIQEDILANQATDVAGLVISWDLWHIPTERLQMLRNIYYL